MDAITFDIGDVTIQLVNGMALFWMNGTDHTPDIELPIAQLQNALSTAHMLLKDRGMLK